jgi:hypothetical protein
MRSLSTIWAIVLTFSALAAVVTGLRSSGDKGQRHCESSG